MKKWIHCLINLLLCLVIFTGAVACTTGKGTSGQKADSIREHQSKLLVTSGKHREKPDTTKEVVSERVVIENNLLFMVTPDLDIVAEELKESNDPLYRLTDKYVSELEARAESGDQGAAIELQRREIAEENAKKAVVLYATVVGGYYTATAAPEIIAAAKAGAITCAENPVLCANQVGTWIIEMLGAEAAPAGIAITGTAGYTVKLTKEQLVELATLQAVRKEGGDVTPEMVNKVISGNASKEIPKVTSEQKVIEIKSGSKGDWNKELNKPEPNTIYQVDGNKTYKTDSQGRIETVEAKLSLNSNDRNTYQQCKVGKCGVAGDEGGHLIATIFTDPGEKLNIVPMNSNLNRSEWKKMENSWAKALKEDKQVDVKIEPVYIGNSDRPSSFNVMYKIGNEWPVERTFINDSGGK